MMFACGAPVVAQTPPSAIRLPTSLVVSVLEYRVHFIDRATRIDACSVAHAMSAPADFPIKLPGDVRELLTDQNLESCSIVKTAAPDSTVFPATSRVTIESSFISDHAGTVTLQVRWGEYIHREDYSVKAIPDGDRWGIGEVRITGALRARFVNP
jgi:hypothetical protein